MLWINDTLNEYRYINEEDHVYIVHLTEYGILSKNLNNVGRSAVTFLKKIRDKKNMENEKNYENTLLYKVS